MATRRLRLSRQLFMSVALLFGAFIIGVAAVSASSGSGGKGATPPPSKSGSSKGGPSSPTSYFLQGDFANPIGAATTYFTSTTNDPDGAWQFFSTAQNGTGLAGFCLESTSSNCLGVLGKAYGDGVHGVTLLAGGNGVYGDGYTYGGYGVQGTANNLAGVYGVAYGNFAEGGVYGIAQGAASQGIYGTSSGDSGYGVYGVSHGAGDLSRGVVGASDNAEGVYGQGRTGVYGEGGNYGLIAKSVSASGEAIFADSPGPATVHGRNTSASSTAYAGYFTATVGTALYGYTANGFGVYGYSYYNYGLTGGSHDGFGIRAGSTSNYGLYATTVSGPAAAYVRTTSGLVGLRAVNTNVTANHYAILADGNVRVNGTLHATGGIVAIAPTDQGDVQTYSEQASRNIMSDEGTATLVNGRAVVKIDPLFAKTVNLAAGYRVFAMPRSLDTVGLGVVDQTATSFTVGELNKGSGNFSFDWRITAVRKGYEKERLAPAPASPAAPTDKAYTSPDTLSPLPEPAIPAAAPARPQSPNQPEVEKPSSIKDRKINK